MTFSLLLLLIKSLHTLLRSHKGKPAVKSFFIIFTIPSSKSVVILLNDIYHHLFHVFHIAYKYFRTMQQTIFGDFCTLSFNNTVSNNQISAKKLVLSWF